MVFDVSVALTWILYLALFPMAFFWFRRAWRIVVKRDFSEVAIKRGESPPDPEKYAPYAMIINLIAGVVAAVVIVSVALGQLDRVAEMAAGEIGVLELLKGDPAQRDVDPEVVATRLERVAEGVSGLFRVARLPELQALLVVQPSFLDATRVDQVEGLPMAGDHGQSDWSRRDWPGSVRTAPAIGSGTTPLAALARMPPFLHLTLSSTLRCFRESSPVARVRANHEAPLESKRRPRPSSPLLER